MLFVRDAPWRPAVRDMFGTNQKLVCTKALLTYYASKRRVTHALKSNTRHLQCLGVSFARLPSAASHDTSHVSTTSPCSLIGLGSSTRDSQHRNDRFRRYGYHLTLLMATCHRVLKSKLEGAEASRCVQADGGTAQRTRVARYSYYRS